MLWDFITQFILGFLHLFLPSPSEEDYRLLESKESGKLEP